MITAIYLEHYAIVQIAGFVATVVLPLLMVMASAMGLLMPELGVISTVNRAPRACMRRGITISG